ncbi:MAG TPA: PEP-CTERM sorting domain-containing protein [Candidatus Nitrosopolaris sp.]|nr:PEP-CTERM sorting domain-containing protein [Candidatus Nitrosopolaris sp.]
MFCIDRKLAALIEYTFVNPKHFFSNFFRQAFRVRIFAGGASLAVLLAAAPATAQIYVVNAGSGTIGEYSLSGQTINSSFITGLSSPTGLAVSGGYLYVAQENGTIREYTTSGALVNPSLISGLYLPWGIAISGNNLFVANAGGESSTIGEYTINGATVNASLVTGLGNPTGLATDGTYLYVTCWHTGTVGIYTTSGAGITTFGAPGAYPGGIVLDGSGHVYVSTLNGVGEYTTAGVPINPTLISGGYNSGVGIALDGNGHLFWADNYGGAGGNVIGEYTTNGQLINANFITGLSNPVAMVLVPEPATSVLVLVGLAGLVCRSVFRRRAPGK